MNSTRFFIPARSCLFLVAIALLLLASLPATAVAQESANPITLTATAGFDSYYKGEEWIPVYVNLTNDGPPIDGYVQLRTDANSPGDQLIYRAPISLPTQSEKRVLLYTTLPNLNTRLQIELVSGNNLLAETETDPLTRIPSEDLLYGIVSPDPGEFAFLEAITGSRSDAYTAFLTLDELPDAPSAWNTLDILIFNAVDTGQLTTSQQAALNAWVTTGGQLIITGGPDWQKTSAGLADYLPVTISGSETVADLPGLAAATGAPFRDSGPYVVTNSSLTQGELLFHEDGLPILARQSYGRGAVYFLGLDPRFAPLLDWDGTEQIFAEVANRIPPDSLWGAPPMNSYAANTAVTSLPELTIPPVWQMALFLIIYTLIIGPVNYQLLKRRGTPEKAWVTIPAFILIFTGITYLTGFQLRGQESIINQISISYSHSDSNQARIQSLIGLYSPQRKYYDLLFDNTTLVRPFESGFSSTLNGNGNIDALTYAAQNSVDRILVDISGIETFIAQDIRPAPPIHSDITITLKEGALQLNGIIQNNSDINLEAVTLLIGDAAIPLSDLPAGQSHSFTEAITTYISGSGGLSAPYSSNTLSYNATTILDNANYYNDPIAYPRYQLLESLNSSYTSVVVTTIPNSSVFLLAWSTDPQLDVSLQNGEFSQLATTLHIIEVPLKQDIVSNGRTTIPQALLTWSTLNQGGLYNASITDLNLNDAWIELEYQPWPEFQTMQVETLDIMLEQNSSDPGFVPELRLWNWSQDRWENVDAAQWGATAVPNPTPYIGPGATVRLRLEDQDNSYNPNIEAVYPLLTGTLTAAGE
jgi:hypothetical protein